MEKYLTGIKKYYDRMAGVPPVEGDPHIPETIGDLRRIRAEYENAVDIDAAVKKLKFKQITDKAVAMVEDPDKRVEGWEGFDINVETEALTLGFYVDGDRPVR